LKRCLKQTISRVNRWWWVVETRGNIIL